MILATHIRRFRQNAVDTATLAELERDFDLVIDPTPGQVVTLENGVSMVIATVEQRIRPWGGVHRPRLIVRYQTEPASRYEEAMANGWTTLGATAPATCKENVP